MSARQTRALTACPAVLRCRSRGSMSPAFHRSSQPSSIAHFATHSAANAPRHERLRMIILGAPGSGKGTQSERLLKRWDIKTVGVGDLLRNQVRRRTELGLQAEAVMKSGGLLPDSIVLKLVEPELLALKDQDWLLDGFPRKASQAVLLDELLRQHGDGLNCVASLVVPDEVILERIEGRWVHPPSNRVYNTTYNPPKVPFKDDVTGEDLVKRPDDTAEIFGKRLASFHAENDPLLTHYAKVKRVLGAAHEEMPILVSLKGRTSDEIYPQLEKVLESRFPALKERHAS